MNMSRRHRYIVFGAGIAALTIASVARSGGAGVSLSGSVKATGLATNADAVVYVEQVAAGSTPPATSSTMDQRSMRFAPHVLPIVAGSTVKFLNSDPTQHNVFSPDHEKFNLGTWPQGETKNYAFSKCARFPCAYVLLCRIHPEMEAFVVVLQNPFFAVTDAAGHYEIKNLPPGKYTVGVWHPKLKAPPKQTTLEATGGGTVDFTLAK
jgi:plastocyanin